MRPEPQDRRDRSTLKLYLSALLWAAWALQQFLIDKDVMVSLAGASAEEVSYWGTKGAGFALLAAVSLFVSSLPARNQWANLLPMAAGGVAAIWSGFYWLQESTNGHASSYLLFFAGVGVVMGFCLVMGPGLIIAREWMSKIRLFR